MAQSLPSPPWRPGKKKSLVLESGFYRRAWALSCGLLLQLTSLPSHHPIQHPLGVANLNLDPTPINNLIASACFSPPLLTPYFLTARACAAPPSSTFSILALVLQGTEGTLKKAPRLFRPYHLSHPLAPKRLPFVNTTKLAGTHFTKFSFIRPLLGPKFRVFFGGIVKPP